MNRKFLRTSIFFLILSGFGVLNAQSYISLSEDKCGFDPEVSAQMQRLLGQNWGYSYDSLLVDLGKWSQSPYVTVDSIGASVLNRAIWQLKITAETLPLVPRRTVFIHARTHPNEVQAFWVTDEMINMLLSEDPFAQFLRDNCTFFILPMYNPDGVELGLPRQNANGIDIESGWDDAVQQPEVTVLRNRFIELMNAPEPIEVALNMHSAIACKRYFVYHHQNGTSLLFTQLEKQFIGDVQSYFPTGIEPWDYYVSWSNGTPNQYPESWWWMNHGEDVMALTYEDMNCATAGQYDQTAYATLHGISDYLGLVVTAIAGTPAPNYGQNATLGQNYPNPVQLSAGTTLSTVFLYQLAQPQEIRLAIYDVLGRRIAVVDEGYRSATTHRVFFDASDLPSGNYFYRLETPQGVQMNRFQVIR